MGGYGGTPMSSPGGSSTCQQVTMLPGVTYVPIVGVLDVSKKVTFSVKVASSSLALCSRPNTASTDAQLPGSALAHVAWELRALGRLQCPPKHRDGNDSSSNNNNRSSPQQRQPKVTIETSTTRLAEGTTPRPYLVPVDCVFDGVYLSGGLVNRLATEDKDAPVHRDGSGAVAQALVGEVEQLSGVGPAVGLGVVPLCGEREREKVGSRSGGKDAAWSMARGPEIHPHRCQPKRGSLQVNSASVTAAALT